MRRLWKNKTKEKKIRRPGQRESLLSDKSEINQTSQQHLESSKHLFVAVKIQRYELPGSNHYRLSCHREKQQVKLNNYYNINQSERYSAPLYNIHTPIHVDPRFCTYIQYIHSVYTQYYVLPMLSLLSPSGVPDAHHQTPV